MKRIKIMLLSLFVLATVGGVLAFKAKEPNICVYKKASLTATTCPRIVIAETVATTATGLFYTTLNVDGVCPTFVTTPLCSINVVASKVDQ